MRSARPLAGVDLMLDPHLPQSQMLKLRDLLTEHPGDVPVILEMQLADRTVRIATPDNLKIQLVPELVTSIEASSARAASASATRARRPDGRGFPPGPREGRVPVSPCL